MLVLACASPDPHANMDSAGMASSAAEEQSAPSEPSDLLLRLGGQTGSEMANGVATCAARHTDYALSAVTPLGFAATALAESIASRSYRAAWLGLEERPADVSVTLTPPATLIDRDPSSNPDLACIDALRVGAAFEISAGEQTLALPVTDLFADSPERFAGASWIEVATTPSHFAGAALGDSVHAVVEGSAGGARFWFYRRVDSLDEELLGHVWPVR